MPEMRHPDSSQYRFLQGTRRIARASNQDAILGKANAQPWQDRRLQIIISTCPQPTRPNPAGFLLVGRARIAGYTVTADAERTVAVGMRANINAVHVRAGQYIASKR